MKYIFFKKKKEHNCICKIIDISICKIAKLFIYYICRKNIYIWGVGHFTKLHFAIF